MNLIASAEKSWKTSWTVHACTVQCQCPAISLLSGMGEGRSRPNPETDELGKGAATDAASAPGNVPDRIYRHLSGPESWSFDSEIPERCRNRSTDDAPRSC